MHFLWEKIKSSDSRMKQIVGEKKQKSLRFTGAACIANTLLGTGKLALGLFSLSPFTCASAFYTYGMVAAKLCALSGLGKDEKKQGVHYLASSCILIAASLLYALYSVRLFLNPHSTYYPLYIALAIATFTFTEITLNVRGVFVERKNKNLLLYAVKMESLASSLICLVLTQTAILSFTHDMPDYDPSKTNGFFGLLMGGVATLMGCWMLYRYQKGRKNEHDSHSGC